MLKAAKNAQITFDGVDTKVSVTCLIGGDGIQTVSDSFGGWDVLNRPRNVGVLNWTGYPPLALSVPVLFDNWHSQTSVEDDIANLERLAGRGPGFGGTRQPPTLRLSTVDGFSKLIPHGDDVNRWVIQTIDWGDALRRGKQPDGSGGHRVRQEGTVSLLQYTAVDLTVEKSASKRANGHQRTQPSHVVKKGETLRKISQKEYGSPDYWQEIANANGIHDPRHLPVGKKLKLPKVKL